jgi:flagellar biosynthesis protein FlhF
MRHGTKKVALITADSYRIGGHEQLRIYGKLLGLPVRAVKDTEDLQLTLEDLRDKHVVLIDTVGMGQRDEMVAEQLGMLTSCGADVKRLLLLNATSNGRTLDDVVRAYQGDGLHGCIVTKLDEAACFGTVVDTLVRHRLNLHYVADGQRVPEDLHIAQSEALLRRVFSTEPVEPPFDLQDAECAAVMASASAHTRPPHLPVVATATSAGAAHA